MRESMNIKEDAEFFKLGLLAGYVTPQEVIQWADTLIAQQDKPSGEILDISIATSPDDLVVKLRKIEGAYDWSRVVQRFFNIVYDALQQDHSRAASIARDLYHLMHACEQEFSPDIQHAIYYFDDGFDLANQRIYGNSQQLTQELLDFLQRQIREMFDCDNRGSVIIWC